MCARAHTHTHRHTHVHPTRSNPNFPLQREGLEAHVKPFARRDLESQECQDFMSTIRQAKPTGLIGLAGAGRLFTPEALT